MCNMGWANGTTHLLVTLTVHTVTPLVTCPSSGVPHYYCQAREGHVACLFWGTKQTCIGDLKAPSQVQMSECMQMLQGDQAGV